MAKVSIDIQDLNGNISLDLLAKYDEFIECTQITYYVDGKLLFKEAGKIMINRRDNYPKIQILSPNTGDYTESFQENSCTFTDLGDLDMISIETSYTPHKIGKLVNVKVVIVF